MSMSTNASIKMIKQRCTRLALTVLVQQPSANPCLLPSAHACMLTLSTNTLRCYAVHAPPSPQMADDPHRRLAHTSHTCMQDRHKGMYSVEFSGPILYCKL